MGRPTTTRRDRLYEALRDAGAAGLTLTQLGELGVSSPLAHIESLRWEGHAILVLSGTDPRTRTLVRRVSLVRDVWAGDEAAA